VGDVTGLLIDWRGGDEAALEQLTPLIYQELRKLAGAYMRRERSDHTLQPTALINEAYVRLVDRAVPDFNSRTHFFGIAARLMRQVLVDFARSKQAVKRGDDGEKVDLDEALVVAEAPAAKLLDLNDALDRLAQINERQARVLELRYFGGLSRGEVAEALDISLARVKRDLAEAEDWLRIELSA
jgi:RNA polymerase sigma factor (TIGR02999 family)